MDTGKQDPSRVIVVSLSPESEATIVAAVKATLSRVDQAVSHVQQAAIDALWAGLAPWSPTEQIHKGVAYEVGRAFSRRLEGEVDLARVAAAAAQGRKPLGAPPVSPMFPARPPPTDPPSAGTPRG